MVEHSIVRLGQEEPSVDMVDCSRVTYRAE